MKKEVLKFKNNDEHRMLLNGDRDYIYFDEDEYEEMEKRLRKLYKHIKTTSERNGGDADYDCCETIIQRKSDKKFFMGEFTYDNMCGLRENGNFTEIEYEVKKRKAKKAPKSIIQKISDIQKGLETKDNKRWTILEKCIRDLLTLEPRD